MQKLFDRFEKFEMLQKRDKICDKITEGNFPTTSGHFRVDRNIPLGSELTPLSGSRVISGDSNYKRNIKREIN